MKFTALLFCLVIASPAFPQDTPDSVFLAARDAFRAGDRKTLDRAATQVGNHVLAPYVENFQLRFNIDRGDTTALRAFLERHEQTYVAEKMRADWIRWLGKRAMWNEIGSQYPRLVAPDPDVTCYAQQARLATGDRTALDEIRKLWLTMLDPPESCRPVFDALLASGRMSTDEVWERARRQFENNRTGPAKVTLGILPPGQAVDSRALDALIASPLGYLVRQSGNSYGTRAGREMAALAVQRMASNDPRAAATELDKIQERLQEPQRRWAWSQVGLQGAKRHQAEALVWYARAGLLRLSDDGYQWKVRAALREQDWGVVLAAVREMPPALAAQPEWIYWLGRAFKAGGLNSEASAQFEKIAGQANFYGNLADEELGRKVITPPRAAPLTAEEQRAARDNPALRRAIALFRLDMRAEAVKEWNWSLRGMTDRELLAAADLARKNQIWDRAIATADRTREEHDFSLRYIAPYGEQVRPAALNQSLDDAWVYGLMRQESRFVTGAKSSAGASGLMQLMPATAKWVAKKIGLRDFNPAHVNDTETNVLLGTSYMRLVMADLDNHPVLASAAYNAGPGRARRWRSDRPLEGAIYAETIPFSETRDYVKKVMSNSVYYRNEFTGHSDSLKARLGVIGARLEDTPKDKDLP